MNEEKMQAIEKRKEAMEACLALKDEELKEVKQLLSDANHRLSASAAAEAQVQPRSVEVFSVASIYNLNSIFFFYRILHLQNQVREMTSTINKFHNNENVIRHERKSLESECVRLREELESSHSQLQTMQKRLDAQVYCVESL